MRQLSERRQAPMILHAFLLFAGSAVPADKEPTVSFWPPSWKQDTFYLLRSMVTICGAQVGDLPPATKRAELWVDLPRTVELISSKQDEHTTERVTRDGVDHVRYRMGKMRHFIVRPGATAPDSFAIYAMAASGGQVLSEKRFRALVLPELPDVDNRPKRFRIMPYHFLTYSLKTNDINAAVLEIAVRCGINSISQYWGSMPEFCKLGHEKYGIPFYAQLGMWGYSNQDMDRHTPVEAAGEDANGKPIRGCPIWLLGHPDFLGKYSFRVYQGLVKRPEIVGVNNDWEEHGFPHCCCKRCLAKFSEWSGYPSEGLTVESLRGKYRRAWAAFGVWQHSEYVRLFCAAIHRADPNAKVELCNQYPVKDRMDRWEIRGSDLSVFDLYVDAHTPMMYSFPRAYHDDVDRTVRMLKRPVVPLVEINYGTFHAAIRPAKFIRVQMISTATAGAAGVSWYRGDIAMNDGEYLHAIAKSAADIKALEPFFLDGVRDDGIAQVTGLPYERKIVEVREGKSREYGTPDWGRDLDLRGFVLGKQRLLVFFNFNSDLPAYVRVAMQRLPEGQYRLTLPRGGGQLTKAGRAHFESDELEEGLVWRVPAFDVAYLLAERIPKIGSPAEGKGLPVEALEREYRQACKTETIPLHQSGQVTVRGGSKEGGNVFELVAATRSQTVYLSPTNGGKIISWQAGDRELVGHAGASYGGGFGFDLFWYPGAAGWAAKEVDAAYEIVSRSIQDGVAAITLRRKFTGRALRDLVITKTYHIPSDQTAIDVQVQFANESSRVLDFSYWSHHVALLGQDEVKETRKTLRESMVYFVPSEAGPVRMEGDVYRVPGAPLTPGWESFEKAAKQRTITKGFVEEYSPLTHELMRAEFDYEALLQVYCCHNAEPPSLEWMYRRRKLAPGETWGTSYRLIYKTGVQRDVALPAAAAQFREYDPDQPTVLLEHFNGSYRGKWYGGPDQFGPGVFGYLGEKNLAAKFGAIDLPKNVIRTGFRVTPQATVECWVKPMGLQKKNATIAAAGTAGNTKWRLYLRDGKLCAFVQCKGRGVSVTGPPIPQGKWTHVAFCYDGSPSGGLTLYANSEVAAHQPGIIVPYAVNVSDALWIGSAPWWEKGRGEVWYSNLPFRGLIDELRISSVARSQFSLPPAGAPD